MQRNIKREALRFGAKLKINFRLFWSADCVSAGSGAEGRLERSGRPSVSGPLT